MTFSYVLYYFLRFIFIMLNIISYILYSWIYNWMKKSEKICLKWYVQNMFKCGEKGKEKAVGHWTKDATAVNNC